MRAADLWRIPGTYPRISALVLGLLAEFKILSRAELPEAVQIAFDMGEHFFRHFVAQVILEPAVALEGIR